MTRIVDELELHAVSVPRGTTFAFAAERLASSGVAMLAVVDESARVVGLFGAGQVLAGILPRYVLDLHHTAFVPDDPGIVSARTAAVRDEPVERHVARAVTIERDASALHVGEVFLHCGLPAIAVVDRTRFSAILERAEFARALMRRCE
ncbi:MAG: hypothetical protein M3327_01320 [Actinomycetota bacterium]|nr:hypothetical protein [Actinomycetota bacterium]